MPWSNQAVNLIELVEVTGFSGLFVYSPAIAHGDLQLSIAAQAGTDPENNPYVPQLAVYGANGQIIQLVNNGGTAQESFLTGSATEFAPGQMKSGVIDRGGPAEQQVLVVGGPTNTVSHDAAFVQLSSSPNNGADEATGFLEYQLASGGDQPLLAWGGEGVSRYTIAGMNGGIPLTLMDSFVRTINTATPGQQLTRQYSVPANDPLLVSNQQTIYSIKAWGQGTQGNPAEIPTFQLSYFGVTSTLYSQPVVAASDGFNWYADIWVVVKTAGATGTATLGGTIQFYDFTNPGSALTVPVLNTVTINTAAASTFGLLFNWAAIGGTPPTISCFGSIMQRTGS